MSGNYINSGSINLIQFNKDHINNKIIDNKYIILNNLNQGIIINNNYTISKNINNIFCVFKTNNNNFKLLNSDINNFNTNTNTNHTIINNLNNIFIIKLNNNFNLSPLNNFKMFNHDSNIYEIYLYELIICSGIKNIDIIELYLLNKYTKNMDYNFNNNNFDIYAHIHLNKILSSLYSYQNILSNIHNDVIVNNISNNSKTFPNNNLSYYATSNNNIDILSIHKICSINSDNFSICGFENGFEKSVLNFKNTINNTSIKLNINTDIVINNKLLDSNGNNGNKNNTLMSTNDGKLIWNDMSIKSFDTTDDLLNANITENGTVATVLNPIRLWIYNNSKWASLTPTTESMSIISADYTPYYNNIKIGPTISFNTTSQFVNLHNSNIYVIANINIKDDITPTIQYTYNTNFSTTNISNLNNPNQAIYMIKDKMYNYTVRLNSLTSNLIENNIYNFNIKDTNDNNIITKTLNLSLNKPIVGFSTGIPVINEYYSIYSDGDVNSNYKGWLYQLKEYSWNMSNTTENLTTSDIKYTNHLKFGQNTLTPPFPNIFTSPLVFYYGSLYVNNITTTTKMFNAIYSSIQYYYTPYGNNYLFDSESTYPIQFIKADTIDHFYIISNTKQLYNYYGNLAYKTITSGNHLTDNLYKFKIFRVNNNDYIIPRISLNTWKTNTESPIYQPTHNTNDSSISKNPLQKYEPYPLLSDINNQNILIKPIIDTTITEPTFVHRDELIEYDLGYQYGTGSIFKAKTLPFNKYYKIYNQYHKTYISKGMWNTSTMTTNGGDIRSDKAWNHYLWGNIRITKDPEQAQKFISLPHIQGNGNRYTTHLYAVYDDGTLYKNFYDSQNSPYLGALYSSGSGSINIYPHGTHDFAIYIGSFQQNYSYGHMLVQDTNKVGYDTRANTHTHGTSQNNYSSDLWRFVETNINILRFPIFRFPTNYYERTTSTSGSLQGSLLQISQIHSNISNIPWNFVINSAHGSIRKEEINISDLSQTYDAHASPPEYHNLESVYGRKKPTVLKFTGAYMKSIIPNEEKYSKVQHIQLVYRAAFNTTPNFKVARTGWNNDKTWYENLITQLSTSSDPNNVYREMWHVAHGIRSNNMIGGKAQFGTNIVSIRTPNTPTDNIIQVCTMTTMLNDTDTNSTGYANSIYNFNNSGCGFRIDNMKQSSGVGNPSTSNGSPSSDSSSYDLMNDYRGYQNGDTNSYYASIIDPGCNVKNNSLMGWPINSGSYGPVRYPVYTFKNLNLTNYTICWDPRLHITSTAYAASYVKNLEWGPNGNNTNTNYRNRRQFYEPWWHGDSTKFLYSNYKYNGSPVGFKDSWNYSLIGTCRDHEHNNNYKYAHNPLEYSIMIITFEKSIDLRGKEIILGGVAAPRTDYKKVIGNTDTYDITTNPIAYTTSWGSGGLGPADLIKNSTDATFINEFKKGYQYDITENFYMNRNKLGMSTYNNSWNLAPHNLSDFELGYFSMYDGLTPYHNTINYSTYDNNWAASISNTNQDNFKYHGDYLKPLSQIIRSLANQFGFRHSFKRLKALRYGHNVEGYEPASASNNYNDRYQFNEMNILNTDISTSKYSYCWDTYNIFNLIPRENAAINGKLCIYTIINNKKYYLKCNTELFNLLSEKYVNPTNRTHPGATLRTSNSAIYIDCFQENGIPHPTNVLYFPNKDHQIILYFDFVGNTTNTLTSIDTIEQGGSSSSSTNITTIYNNNWNYNTTWTTGIRPGSLRTCIKLTISIKEGKYDNQLGVSSNLKARDLLAIKFKDSLNNNHYLYNSSWKHDTSLLYLTMTHVDYNKINIHDTENYFINGNVRFISGTRIFKSVKLESEDTMIINGIDKRISSEHEYDIYKYSTLNSSSQLNAYNGAVYKGYSNNSINGNYSRNEKQFFARMYNNYLMKIRAYTNINNTTWEGLLKGFPFNDDTYTKGYEHVPNNKNNGFYMYEANYWTQDIKYNIDKNYYTIIEHNNNYYIGLANIEKRTAADYEREYPTSPKVAIFYAELCGFTISSSTSDLGLSNIDTSSNQEYQIWPEKIISSLSWTEDSVAKTMNVYQPKQSDSLLMELDVDRIEDDLRIYKLSDTYWNTFDKTKIFYFASNQIKKTNQCLTINLEPGFTISIFQVMPKTIEFATPLVMVSSYFNWEKVPTYTNQENTLFYGDLYKAEIPNGLYDFSIEPGVLFFYYLSSHKISEPILSSYKDSTVTKYDTIYYSISMKKNNITYWMRKNTSNDNIIWSNEYKISELDNYKWIWHQPTKHNSSNKNIYAPNTNLYGYGRSFQNKIILDRDNSNTTSTYEWFDHNATNATTAIDVNNATPMGYIKYNDTNTYKLVKGTNYLTDTITEGTNNIEWSTGTNHALVSFTIISYNTPFPRATLSVNAIQGHTGNQTLNITGSPGPFALQTSMSGLNQSNSSGGVVGSFSTSDSTAIITGFDDKTYIVALRTASGQFFHNYDKTKFFSVTSAWDHSIYCNIIVSGLPSGDTLRIFHCNYNNTTWNGMGNSYTNYSTNNTGVDYFGNNNNSLLEYFEVPNGTHTVGIPATGMCFIYATNHKP